MVGYLALFSIFILLFALSFYFGFREWWRPQDNSPLRVDVEYVRAENYFGTSFRAKMNEWMQTARLVDPGAERMVRAVLERPNGERILVVEAGEFGGPDAVNSLVYCSGDLRIRDGSAFHREIYARGAVECGRGAQLQALASDGHITLGNDTEVFRWVDAARAVVLRQGARVHSRVSSMESVELACQVSAQSLFAPVVFSAGYDRAQDSYQADRGSDIAPPTSGGAPAEFGKSGTATRLGEDTWQIEGDLALKEGTEVAGNLVVRGGLRSGPDCVFRGSLRARDVVLGAGNRVRGGAVSSGALRLGEGCRIDENVVSETDIVLAAGVRIGKPASPAVVSAGGTIHMEGNVAVFGKLSAGRAVMTV